MATVDLNADLGETVAGVPTADDEAMFAVISSASVACGGHAGDAASMRAAVERAARFGVAVGAHPSYADRANFGRTAMAPDPADLQAEIAGQLTALADAGAQLRYVKPHGALYHAVSLERGQAAAVARAVAGVADRLGRALPILGQPGFIEDSAAAVGLPFVVEAFLDRGYLATGRLVARTAPGALLEDPEEAAARAVRFAVEGAVTAVDGARVAVAAASLCVHGDSPGAVAMARAVRTALDDAGVSVRAPW